MFNRLRDQLGRFIKPVAAETLPENVQTEEIPNSSDFRPKQDFISTKFSIGIEINGKPIDLTDMSKEEAVVLFNFGILSKAHFIDICRLEGWNFNELAEYEDMDDDEDV